MKIYAIAFTLLILLINSTAFSQELEYGSIEWIEDKQGPDACSITAGETGLPEDQLTLILMRDILNYVAENKVSHTLMVVTNFRVFSMTHDVSPALIHLRNIAQVPRFNQRILTDLESIENELEKNHSTELSKSVSQKSDTYIFCQIWSLLNNQSPKLNSKLKTYGGNVVSLPE